MILDIFQLNSPQLLLNVLANHQITVYLPDTYKTTPELSFAVRNLSTTAGIMITASHNPKTITALKYMVLMVRTYQCMHPQPSRYIEEVGYPLQIDIPSSNKIHLISSHSQNL